MGRYLVGKASFLKLVSSYSFFQGAVQLDYYNALVRAKNQDLEKQIQCFSPHST